MTASTRKRFGTEQSRSAGKDRRQRADGNVSGRRIIALFKAKRADMTTDDYAHMRKVVRYAKRHLAHRCPWQRILAAHIGYAEDMPTVMRTLTVAVLPDQVINYLKDFANAEEWDPGTQSCTRNDDGPIDVGASWHNVSKLFGFTTELTYTLEELTDRTIVFVGTNHSSTDRETITVDTAGDGSIIRYEAELTMHGVARLFSPAMKIVSKSWPVTPKSS